jgi:hypothetical protein
MLNDLTLRDTLRRKENVAERIKNAYKAMRVILPFVKRTRLPWKLTLRTMEEIIITTLRGAAARRVDADEEPDHRIFGKMLDNKTINNRITTVRVRHWGPIRRQEREHILRKAEVYEIREKLKIGRPCHTHHESCERDVIKSGKNWDTLKAIAENRAEMKKQTVLLYEVLQESDAETIYTSEDE